MTEITKILLVTQLLENHFIHKGLEKVADADAWESKFLLEFADGCEMNVCRLSAMKLSAKLNPTPPYSHGGWARNK